MPSEAQLDYAELYGIQVVAPKPTVEVPGVWEATQSATWDHPMTRLPMFVRGPSRGKLGSTAVEGSEVMRQRPELFRPLRIEIDHPAE